jgi:nucleoid-associated protein YgaU
VLSTLPFTRSQLAALDDALVRASSGASLHFGIYLGDLGDDTRIRAEELHSSMGEWADDAVLVAVSPGQRVVEVVTGGKAGHRLPDRGCKLAVESMVSSFKEGDLTGGLTSGLRILTDHTSS